MCFKLNYKVLGTDLFILCSHSHPNTINTKLLFRIKKIDFPEVLPLELDALQAIQSEQSMINAFYAQITTWLEEQFRLIKNEPDYIRVQRVVFASDVNLGRPGDPYCPDFLLDDYIQKQFAPNKVKKILFSSCPIVVAIAIERFIKDAEIINSSELPKKVKDRFKTFLITPATQQLSNIEDSKKQEKDALVVTPNLNKPIEVTYRDVVIPTIVEDPKATTNTGTIDNRLFKVKEDKVKLPVIIAQPVTPQVNSFPIEDQKTINLSSRLFKRKYEESGNNEEQDKQESMHSVGK